MCGVKPHVLRYWEQEFTQLKPMKRRGNRRYYQHHEVLMIRRIRDLLYEQGFTISGARNRLQEFAQAERDSRRGVSVAVGEGGLPTLPQASDPLQDNSFNAVAASFSAMSMEGIEMMRRELGEIRQLLTAEAQLAL